MNASSVMTLTMTQLMSAINLRLWSQNHKWLKYCFFSRLVPAAGNFCPQRGQSCDNFSQSKSACSVGSSWKVFPYLFFHCHLHLYALQDETVQREKSLKCIFFWIIIIFKGLLALTLWLKNTSVVQEAVLAHQAALVYAVQQPQLKVWWLPTRAGKFPRPTDLSTTKN